MATITLNDSSVTIEENLTLKDLLINFQYENSAVAIAVNFNFITFSSFLHDINGQIFD